MDALLRSTGGISFIPYKTFSYTYAYTLGGLHYLSSIFTNALFIFKKIQYTIEGLLMMYDVQSYINRFRRSRKRYMIVSLAIYYENGGGHAVILIFEKKPNEIICELYDPSYSCLVEDSVSNTINTLLRSQLRQYGVRYSTPSDLSVIVCPQACSRDIFGYCQTYSLLYVKKVLSSRPGTSRLSIMRNLPVSTELDAFITDVYRSIRRKRVIPNIIKEALAVYDTLSDTNKFIVADTIENLLEVD
jgi:hypothetical protein